MSTRTLTEIPMLASLVPLLAAAGCSPADDDPEATETPEITNVEPGEAESPEVPSAVEEILPDDDDSTYAIDPRSAPDLDLQAADTDRFADATIEAASGSTVNGSLRFHQDGDVMRITGSLRGLDPGKHGLHVHVAGDCSAPDAISAQGHFAPDDDPHGAPQRPEGMHHVGDLGNIVANEDGIAQIDKSDPEMTLGTGENTIVGRAIIVHAEPDDLASQPAGDAGERVGCGVIELDVDPAY